MASTLPPTTRKMRRSREVAAAQTEDSLSGFDAYNLQGDSVTALELFAGEQAVVEATASSSSTSPQSSLPSLANQYNGVLLSYLTSGVNNHDDNNTKDGSGDRFSNQLQKLEAEFSKRHRDASPKKDQTKAPSITTMISPRKRQRNELILAYNRALIGFSQGNCLDAARVCVEHLKPFLEDVPNKPPVSEEIAKVVSRMAFLLLECMLAVSVGRTAVGSRWTWPHQEVMGNCTMSSVVEWLERSLDSEKDPQFKFLLNLYRSRVDLALLDHESGKHDDARIRSARKELKQAMDIFQHKLRPTFGGAETGSVVSSTNSEDLSSAAPTSEMQQTLGSVVLQRHNQSALSLKANSEQLKGNTKKSLILCSEAYTAVANATIDSTYEILHDNNLAVVFETIGKRHLALHALAKGLRAAQSEASSMTFYPDGTARPDQTLLVLHNTAVCALQARNYQSAYECMATCIARSDVFSHRPRCWLRLAEACVGLFSQLSNDRNKFTAVDVNGEPKGVIVDNSLFTDHLEPRNEAVAPILASPEDLDQVKRNPLVRARAALEHVLQDDSTVGSEALSSARLTLSYVYLAFGNYEKALNMAENVLEVPEPSGATDEVTRRCHCRRVATARLYAAESSCALGESVAAMKFLVGDGQEDAFDRLASDLGGVTIETAASNGKGKRRLARAQAVVRSSASAVTAAMGNLTAAKQLAMSAQAMEDAYACNRERSSARRALAYTLLRGGQHGAALSLLRSLR